MSSATEETIKVGPDEVVIQGEYLFILAANEMDWPIRPYCRPPIFFREKKYYLRARHSASAPHVAAYELWPWPSDVHDESPRSVVYNEAYVAARDFDAVDEKRAALWHALLLPVFPLLGFFWSGVKDGLLSKLGFNAISVTRGSVLVAFNFCVLEGIFVGWLRGGLLLVIFDNADLATVDYLLLLVLSVDSLVRASQLIHGNESYPYGLLEWLVPGRRKRYS